MASRRRNYEHRISYNGAQQPSFPEQVSPAVSKAKNGLADQLRAGAQRRLRR